MDRKEIIHQIRCKRSFLCVGLDPDLSKLPYHLSRDAAGVKQFCEEIIAQTLDYCVAYKLNIAFFEPLGWEGFKVFEEIVASIPKTHFIIADAKRGDIGNTSLQYASAFFEKMNCDALTLSPYMGEDSIRPFLSYQNKWAIILGLTSNEGSKDLELKRLENGEYVYESILKSTSQWGTIDNTMYVIGATKMEYFQRIRNIIPHHFLLIPGVGAQGGSLEDVGRHLINDDIGILVNSSREIIYASSGQDFATQAGEKACIIANTMSQFIS